MRNILSWNVTHVKKVYLPFSSKNIDEKFSFIVECKDYDTACVCITNICIIYRARETFVKNISAPSEDMLIMHFVMDINACCDGY